MSDEPDEVVISREDAVFWLDGEGYWRNEGGRFRKKKIIDYFNQSIALDEGGYHVWQDKGDVIEKVYFPYEDTPLFVVDFVSDCDGIVLLLNTGQRIRLDPGRLFISNDNLYTENDRHRIKFSVRAMMKLSKRFSEGKDRRLYVRVGEKDYSIAEKK